MVHYWKIRFLLSMILNKITIIRKKVVVGKGTKIYGRLIIKGSGNIFVGEDCLFNSSIHADPIGGDEHIILRADSEGEIKIGNHCGLSNCAIVSKKSIIIGDRVYIGAGVKVYDTDFHSLDVSRRTSIIDTDIKSESINIHKGVFIGAHSIVLKGVEIGENSIVGAGSVVTKSIPENEVWAGNPARKIRSM